MLMYNLPYEVISNYIFPYLLPMDIFNFVQCSKTTQKIVVSTVNHPISTKLQAVKIMETHFYKQKTTYDTSNDKTKFNNWRKCLKEDCSCAHYRQRGDFVMLDPLYCENCSQQKHNESNGLLYCVLCSELIQKMFLLNLCNLCKADDENFCEMCFNEYFHFMLLSRYRYDCSKK